MPVESTAGANEENYRQGFLVNSLGQLLDSDTGENA